MIYYVEIPHQVPPVCWTRKTEKEIIDLAKDLQSPDDDKVITDFYDACSSLGEDLNSYKVFDSDEEAEQGLKDDSLWACHGGHKAREALRNRVEFWND